MWLPRIMVLSGGGVKAVAHIGALKTLEAAGTLVAVRTWVGLSAGALIAFGICLGYSLAALHDVCERFDFAALQDPAPEGFLSFLDNYGIDTGERLSRFVQALLTIRGYSADMTFAALAATGAPTLRIVATDMTTGRPIIFSAAETPDARLVDGLRASMSLPFYFWPVRGPSGNMLVDGGVHGLYPINLLSVEEQRYALGIMLTQDLGSWTDVSGPDAYVLRLYEIASSAKNELVAQAHAGQTIRVVTPKISMVEFTLTAEQRAELYESGVRGAEVYLAGLRGVKRRRYSI
jgi:predicted acylesterase/phospholipase RssA